MLIHGLSSSDHADELESKLSIGSVYKIKDFFVREAKANYQPCQNKFCIAISLKTEFEEVTSLNPDFCQDSYEFCAFERLKERLKSNVLLSDVIGWLSSIGKIDNVNTKNGPTIIQRLVLKNERGVVLPITLWGDFASQLNADELVETAKTSPVIVALRGLLIEPFKGVTASTSSAAFITLNPQSIDVTDLIQAASNELGIVDLLPVKFETPEKAAEHERELQKTLGELITLRSVGASPNGRYKCQATVAAIDGEKDWTYLGCSKCYKAVSTCGQNYWCEKDQLLSPLEAKQCYRIRMIVQQGGDEAIFLLIGKTAEDYIPHRASELLKTLTNADGNLPTAVEAFCGQTLNFAIRLPKQRFNGNDGDFIISSISGLINETTKTPKRALFQLKDENTSATDENVTIHQQEERKAIQDKSSAMTASPTSSTDDLTSIEKLTKKKQQCKKVVSSIPCNNMRKQTPQNDKVITMESPNHTANENSLSEKEKQKSPNSADNCFKTAKRIQSPASSDDGLPLSEILTRNKNSAKKTTAKRKHEADQVIEVDSTKIKRTNSKPTSQSATSVPPPLSSEVIDLEKNSTKIQSHSTVTSASNIHAPLAKIKKGKT
ncbi:unnamed protein product [Linum tenue]|uniref:Replication protein A OB domain-containing protein n=1 Tax=Linum tenue TaxID=586396 RepID=A0AAV0R1G0_9ROSI|nr:unnamed protein product [Linum tenue]